MALARSNRLSFAKIPEVQEVPDLLGIQRESFTAFLETGLKQMFEEVVSATILEEQLMPTVTIDEEIELSIISASYLSIIDQMEPFGPGNLKPVFVSRHLKANKIKLLKELHLKMSVFNEEDGVVIDAIGFNMPETYEKLKDKPYFDMAYTIEENNFRGNTSIQLHIKDIKFAENSKL